MRLVKIYQQISQVSEISEFYTIYTLLVRVTYNYFLSSKEEDLDVPEGQRLGRVC